ncbi:eukaryotic aspartyl protease [Diplocarpon rosae]|nr:eukaryotic aspartyl protease [Diplocarpon rosae]
MVRSVFSAAGACVASALLASSAFAVPAEERNPKPEDCKKIYLPGKESTHGAIMNLTVGNPPQHMGLLSDWTWHSTWIHTPDCAGVHSVQKCIPPGQQYFDQTKSSTFKNTTYKQQTFNGTDYTPGIPFITTFGQDTICFNSEVDGSQKCLKNTVIANTNLTNPLPVVFDIGGVFGFAPVLQGYNETFYPAPFQFFKGGVLNSVVGWHMCEQLQDATSCHGQDYMTVLGGTDTSVYTPQDTVFHDIVQTGATPLDVFNLPGTSPVNPGAGGLHQVPCSQIKTFPTIFYEIGGTQRISSVPQQYIDTTLIPGKCLLNARVWDRPVDGAQTFFGLQVLSRTYLQFDYATNRVGLTPLNSKLFKRS